MLIRVGSSKYGNTAVTKSARTLALLTDEGSRAAPQPPGTLLAPIKAAELDIKQSGQQRCCPQKYEAKLFWAGSSTDWTNSDIVQTMSRTKGT